MKLNDELYNDAVIENEELEYDDNDEIDLAKEAEAAFSDKADSVNKDAIEIMDEYNNGKKMVASVEPIIRTLHNLQKKDKMSESLLMTIPEGYDKNAYLELVNTYKEGMTIMKNSKEKMIEKLDMFVYYIIGRNFSTFKRFTKDLYQEGILGILKGFDAYNPEKSKPTTYFYIYIVHEMTEFVNLNVNKTTSHYAANIVKVKKAINHFEKAGRDWTIKDIAQETGISAETITQALNIMESSNEMHYETTDYLDAQISKRNPSPEEEYIKNEISQMLQDSIDTLDINEANVIRLKYGLSGEEPMSYKNIAARLGIQIDKIKKYHSAGIRKLRRCKIINGNFKGLKREEKALNDSQIGIIPIKAAEAIMDEVDAAFAED